MSKQLELGQIVITQNLWTELTEVNPEFDVMAELHAALERHHNNDWGDLCKEDKKHNRYALEHGLRILSAYKAQGITFWIITEANRLVTTLPLPEDY